MSCPSCDRTDCPYPAAAAKMSALYMETLRDRSREAYARGRAMNEELRNAADVCHGNGRTSWRDRAISAESRIAALESQLRAAEERTAEAIAAWLEDAATTPLIDRVHDRPLSGWMRRFADGIRRGDWRTDREGAK